MRRYSSCKLKETLEKVREIDNSFHILVVSKYGLAESDIQEVFHWGYMSGQPWGGGVAQQLVVHLV